LISDWRGTTYCESSLIASSSLASLFAHLRIIRTGHAVPLKPRPEENPYTPFYHIWKPAYLWAKNRWDKGSIEGLKEQPPAYYAAAIK
jgi:tRNA-splicing endonuclease subunit Sen54